MEDVFEMLGRDPLDGLGLGQLDGRVLGHVHGHLERGVAGALAHPGLEHPELVLLDGELGVAHVAVVGFQAGEDGQELGVDLGEGLLEGGEGLGVADAGHHVLALGVDQEVAVLALGAGGRVAGEAHAGAGTVVAVAEDHGLDVHGRAEIVGDAFVVAVGDGPGTVPGGEDRFDGPAELGVGILGEGGAGARARRWSCRSRPGSGAARWGCRRRRWCRPVPWPPPGGRRTRPRRCRGRCGRTWPRSAGRSRRRNARRRSAWPDPRPTRRSDPRFKTVSIMPGMENLAPERTLTSSGSALSPRERPIFFSSRVRALATSSERPSGQPASM